MIKLSFQSFDFIPGDNLIPVFFILNINEIFLGKLNPLTELNWNWLCAARNLCIYL